MSLQLLVIMVPVLFGLMGFALDLGRLYLIKGELNQAANAMALAAANQLVGTDAAPGNATTAADTVLDNTNNTAPAYNFGAIPVGQTVGNLTSTVNPPAFFASLSDVTTPGALQASGNTARFVQITLNADAPLLFWSLLPGGQSRKTSVGAVATAGISTPVCTACGIEPIAIAAIDSTDTVNFGFGDPTAATLYTFAYNCSGNPVPTALAGTSTVVRYVILNRYDASSPTLDETQQLYKDGGGGLLSSIDPNPTGSLVPIGCAGINDPLETVWATAAPASCSASAGSSVIEALCGLQSRFDNTDPQSVCTPLVTDFGDLAAQSLPDTDILTGQADPYTSYSGNGRRIITVAVVDTLAANITTTMTVLGFRQFLLEPNSDGTIFSPSGTNAKFPAMYIGSPAPVKQGWIANPPSFGVSCPAPVASGPGKVVIHQ
jgi:Flp pilus assembly protein TadG